MLATGDRTPTSPIPETMVWYGGTPPPHNADWKNPELEAAQSVMSQIEGPTIKGYKPSEVTLGAVVTVQTGTGLTLKPAVSTTTSNVKTNTTAFTETTVSRTMASFLVEVAASSTSTTTGTGVVVVASNRTPTWERRARLSRR